VDGVANGVAVPRLAALGRLRRTADALGPVRVLLLIGAVVEDATWSALVTLPLGRRIVPLWAGAAPRNEKFERETSQ
jgi:hypothetical protein